MAAQRRKKADVTRARILDAAAQVFAERGYAGARLSDIAAVAEMQAGSLYYHFVSREDLVEAVLRAGQERTKSYVEDRVEALPGSSSHLDRLCEAITAHLTMVVEIGAYTSATIRVLGQVPEDIRRRRVADQRAYGAFWRGLFHDAQAAGEIRADVDLSAIRMLLLGALNSSPEWFHPGRLRADQLGAQVASMFLDGLATRRSVRRPLTMPAVMEAARNGVTGVTGVPPGVTSAPRRAATRARILDSAAAVFREQGYAGTRLTDIAAAAGMQAGSLYYHFDSREDLVAELIRQAWERTMTFVRASVESQPPGAQIDRLRAAIAAHVLTTLGSGPYTSSLVRILGQVPEEVRNEAASSQREYTAYWRQLLADAADAGKIRTDLDLSAMEMMLLGALNWTVEWYQPGGRLSPDDIASEFTAVTLDGLAVRRAGRARTAAAISRGSPPGPPGA